MKKISLLVIGILLIAIQCGEEETGPNLPPDTEIKSVTRDPERGYVVKIVWEGHDPDGSVKAYDIAWVSGSLSSNDFPELDWERVTVKESTFSLTADTCCVDGRSYHSHTFLVRAIDNHGAVDSTPAHVGLTATSILPRSRIDYPVGPATTQPTCVTFYWSGTDQDGEAVEYRWGLKRYEDPPAHEPPPPWDPSRWSPWTRATRCTLELDQIDPENPWSFYVQCKDNAGAVEEVFEDGRNHILVYIDRNKVNYPSITICCRHGTCYGSGKTIACRSTSDTTKMDIPVTLSIGDSVCFVASFTHGPYATKVTKIQFQVNDPLPSIYWHDASDSTYRCYPPGSVFVVPEGITTIYVWVKDDYCRYGSVRRAYIKVEGQ